MSADTLIENLFQGRDLALGLHDPGGAGELLVLSLAHPSAPGEPVEPGGWNGSFPGEGERAFLRRAHPTAFLVAFWPHAWSTPELEAAVAVLRGLPAFQRAGRVVLYGHEIGGLGAYLLASRLEADQLITCGAPVDLAPTDGHFDHRWWAERLRRPPPRVNVPEELRRFRGRVDVLTDPGSPLARAHRSRLPQSPRLHLHEIGGDDVPPGARELPRLVAELLDGREAAPPRAGRAPAVSGQAEPRPPSRVETGGDRAGGLLAVSDAQPLEASRVRDLLATLDLLVVADLSLRDASRRVARELAREGLPLVLFPAPGRPASEVLPDLWRNATRFFGCRHFLVLPTPQAVLECQDHGQLLAALGALAPGQLGRLPAAHADEAPPVLVLPGAPELAESAAVTRAVEHALAPGGPPLSGLPTLLGWRAAPGAPPPEGAPLPPVPLPDPSRVVAGVAPSPPGTLDPAYHQAQLYLDTPPFLDLPETLDPSSVLDVGCGLGAYLWILRERLGAEVLGVDGFEASAHFLPAGSYQAHDLTTPLDLGQTFDLVVCTEVLEHLPAASAEVLLDSLARHARGTILFSAARPGQPGEGHVNCRPTHEWIQQWRRRGWVPAVFPTLRFRALSTFHWFRRNSLVLVPVAEAPAPGPYGLRDLFSVEVVRVPWYGQDPGPWTRPLVWPPPAFEQPWHAPARGTSAPG